ncbi:MAG: hypothetical protein ACOC3Z_00565 [Nanoarchaeota archaeon]
MKQLKDYKGHLKTSYEQERAILVLLISTLEERLSNLKKAKNEIDRHLQKIQNNSM